jgi:hypothetical protein
MSVAAGSGAAWGWGAAQAVSAIKMITNVKIFFIFFLLSVVERDPPVLVVYGDCLFCAPFHKDVEELRKFLFLMDFEESILA